LILITNWSHYQSYKDRRPPWIRLHKSLLDNYDFHKMSANARAILPMLWLLASEDDDPVSGRIRMSYEKVSFRLHQSVKDIKSAINELSTPNEAGEVFIQLDQSCNETVTDDVRIRTLRGETEERQRQRQRQSIFVPPTLEEVSQYCQSRNNQVDPVKFHAFYSSKGWKVGRSPMKDWKACIVTWERGN
jgi:hypothetical protein